MHTTVTLHRAGYQRYTVHIPGYGLIRVEGAINPKGASRFRWSATGPGIFLSAITLHGLRAQLQALAAPKSKLGTGV